MFKVVQSGYSLIIYVKQEEQTPLFGQIPLRFGITK